MTKIAIAYDAEEHNYCAIYIDGILAVDAQSYELTPDQVILMLVREGILPSDTEVEEKEFYFEDRIEFPDRLIEPHGDSSTAE